MLFIVLLVATAFFIYKLLFWLDGLLSLPYPGLGLIIILIAITGFGYLTTNFAFKTFTDWFDHGMNRIPLVKLIYSAVKDLLGAFVGDKKEVQQACTGPYKQRQQPLPDRLHYTTRPFRPRFERYGGCILSTLIRVLRLPLPGGAR